MVYNLIYLALLAVYWSNVVVVRNGKFRFSVRFGLRISVFGSVRVFGKNFGSVIGFQFRFSGSRAKAMKNIDVK